MPLRDQKHLPLSRELVLQTQELTPSTSEQAMADT